MKRLFKIKVRSFWLLTFILSYHICSAQIKNLLRNYSLDTLSTNVCGTNNISTALFWDQNPFNDPNAFNTCVLDTFFSVPKNQAGFQFPKHALGYGAISLSGTVFGVNTRLYLQSKLIRKLKNKRHFVYLYLSLADFSYIAVSNLNIAITPNKPINPNCCQFPIPLPLGFTPQIQNPLGNFITDTANWVKFGGSFKANGNEEFITIGNFNSDANSDTMHLRPLPVFNAGECSYYVDNMHLVEEDRAVAYFDTTLEVPLCVNLGDSIVLGDTLVRPWLQYEWKDAFGNILCTTRNCAYYGNSVGTSYATVSITDTAADAYITKAIDTVFITTSSNCPTSIKQLVKESANVKYRIENNQLQVFNLPPNLKNGSILIKGIEGRLVNSNEIENKQGSYSINKQLSKGFYLVELLKDGQVLHRSKVVVD